MSNQQKYSEFFVNFVQTFVSFVVKIRHSSIHKTLCLLVISLFTSVGLCQETKLSESIISIAEELATDEDDPEAVSVYIERLNELAENPVKINSSDEHEISRLFFLSDFQVKALIEYVHSSGQLVSIFELAAIPGFDKQTAEMIMPFISLERRFINGYDSARWNNSIISNFSIKPNNHDTSSLGSLWKILTKYKFTSGCITGGFTMEKDPGEKLLSGSTSLPDFLSAYLVYNGRGVIRRIIVGDYSSRFGQGTNINTGFRRGISVTSQGYMSASDEIMPYTSTEENKFFRGVAAQFELKNLELYVFMSKNHSDATLGSLSGSSFNYIENLYTAGIHNTPSYLNKKDAVSQSAFGINLSYNMSGLKIGIVMSENRFSLPFYNPGSDPAGIYDFTGDRNTIYTIYYNCFIKNILFYGEFSVNNNQKLAAIQGISFRPSDRLSFNFLLRLYNPGYTSFYGNGPGSSSKSTNERGILGNFSYEAAKHLFISGGVELKSIPWLKYRCSGPTQSTRKELRVRFLPKENLTFETSYNYRMSMVDYSEKNGIPDQKEMISRTLKGSVRYSYSDNLTLGLRVDYKIAAPSGGKGTLLMQDLIFRFRKYPVAVWFRYCIFKTDDWDSRLYTYENDLLYSFSIPALSGEGSRSYLMIKWDIGKAAEFRIKYGMTSVVSSESSVKNTDEFKMQFRIWF
jgi:hypothetical protein